MQTSQDGNYLWLHVGTAVTSAKITVSVPKLFHLQALTFFTSTLNLMLDLTNIMTVLIFIRLLQSLFRVFKCKDSGFTV